ncbi:hypothetical protein RSOL_457750 [Rhizoctonia solani AG-3 Rhs1AP]|uniref:Uncharacterized protein n=1 Tax=Rhizoctonia solani AG-3 Rhs1AP TaxID=1086054 RepID=X8JGH9_9AGAM|nr:hypothetical protein RSOL_457750 [Rhizoctonia solani AG-3 Rhs1AP]
MTDSDQVHPLWGPPLDQYIHSYGIDSVQKRASWDVRTELEHRNRGRKAISQICGLASGKKDLEKEVAERVSLSMLRSIMDLTLSPGTFVELGYPDLVGGCIKLMKSVKISEKNAAFKYEYRFLCFRILTVALGVCMLQRARRFDMALARMRAEPETELLLVFSTEVSWLVRTLLTDDQGKKHCDWMLALYVADPPYGPPQQPFTDAYNPMTLLTIMYLDLKNFSKAFASTYSPGLSLVFCLLWRFSIIRVDPVVTGLEKFLKPLFCELYFIYCLVAPGCELGALAKMYSHDVEWWGSAGTGLVDQENSREKIIAYNRRLFPADMRWFSRPPVSLIPVLLWFLLSRIPNGVEDLFPQLFNVTIGCLWEGRIREGYSDEHFLIIARDTLKYLRQV